MEVLIEADRNLEARDGQGMMPLMVAACNGKKEVVGDVAGCQQQSHGVWRPDQTKLLPWCPDDQRTILKTFQTIWLKIVNTG